MKLTKKFMVFLLAAALLFGAAGCASRVEPPAVPEYEAPPAYQAGADVEVARRVTPLPEPPTPPAVEEEPEPESRPLARDIERAPDFDAIAQLGAEPHGWGHGGPVDERNRSAGALMFQRRYVHLDAHFIKPDSEHIYLTFDQGFEYGFTPIILDTLRDKGVPGAFFLTKHFATEHPDLVQRMIDEGHVLANHSVRHLRFPEMTLQGAMDDVMEFHNYVLENFDYDMHLFRFPEGVFNEQTLALLQSLGYTSVFWSFAYRDWELDNQPLTIDAINRMVTSAHPGAIYLLHSVSQTNSEVLGDVIDLIRAEGFEFGLLDLPAPEMG
ncbi:MAG: polysaccharide deacetylase family protein [Oscillospiraceae bacterium]|nr:polysaccharide deacetylase family protein [Oscillospiraceae bacterium]